MLSIYLARKEQGMSYSEDKINSLASSLIWLLVKYKSALEIQFGDYIEEVAQTI
jgi:hypothetical protein